jgi:hypothetical protein
MLTFPSRARVSRCAGFLVALTLAGQAHADPTTRSTLGWAVNGIVSEVARAGDVAFVGGSFATVAPSQNQVFGSAAFAADSAVPVLPPLDVNGRVRTAVALPGGGWLIGGQFTQVNGLARTRLARLLPSGAVDPTFTGSANGTVWTMLVTGSRVYLGGEFSQVNGSSRARLAALDATTLALDSTFVPSVDGGSPASVCAMAVDGATLYFGGAFTTVNGASQANLGAVHATTGASVAGFTGTADGRVNVLALSGTALFAAGEFNSIGGAARRGVARLTAATGVAEAAFNANSDGTVSGLAVSAAGVFVGGSFGHIGGQSREHVAQLSASTGAATAWNPDADGDVEDVALVGSVLLVAGDFQQVGGAERLYLAALDTTRATDNALSWNPALNDGADSLDVDASGVVFVGGDFNYYGAVRRENLAAIDLLTGELLSWNPGANGWVRALDVQGNTVYIGGDFTTIGGVARSRIAALDAVTGVVSSWTAEPNAPVKGLMVFGNAVYFVGEFSQIKNSTSRGRGAAVALDGTVLPWNPAANQTIESVFVTESRAYLGGQFTSLGGVTHNRLGAVDAATGAHAAGFTPSVNGTIYRVDLQNDLLFFGGSFSMVSGSTRENAAAVKVNAGMPDDGALQGWNPNVSGPLYDIDAFGDVVYLAGGFGSVGGESRPGIAMVDALPGGGALRSWEPEDVSGGAISVIDTSNTAVLFGGLLYDENNVQIGAVLYPETTAPGAPRPPTTPDVLIRGNQLTLTWTAPPLGARPTTYVIEGGSASGRSDLANLATGNTQHSFTAAGLGPGTYYLRMRSRNAAGTGAATLEQAFVVGAAGCSGPPAAPLDLRTSVSGTSVTLTWRAAAQSIVSSYRVLAGSASGVANLGTFDVGNVTTFTTTAPTGAYFVRVQAVSACGQGVPSAEAVAVVGSAVVPPGPVFGLEGSVTGSTVTLAWGAPSVGTAPFQYRVEAGSAPGLANLAALVVATPSFTTTGVPPGVYYVRVRAVGVGGVGPAGNEVVVVVQ